VDREGARKADLAAIHVAKARLCWDDGTYRDAMFAVCRVRSAAELDFTGRKRFLEHLRAQQAAIGLEPQRLVRSAGMKAVRAPLTPVQRKLWSLWQQLADAGLVHERTMAGLRAWVKRQTGVDRLEWLNARQEDLVVESAKRWLAGRVER
jgi:hypothetical protein